jgi:hypothetical protein
VFLEKVADGVAIQKKSSWGAALFFHCGAGLVSGEVFSRGGQSGVWHSDWHDSDHGLAVTG